MNLKNNECNLCINSCNLDYFACVKCLNVTCYECTDKKIQINNCFICFMCRYTI